MEEGVWRVRYLLALCNTAGDKIQIVSLEVETDKPIKSMADAEQLKNNIDTWRNFSDIDAKSSRVTAFSKFED